MLNQALMNPCKGICQNYSNRCPTLPESCLILKEFHNAGGGSSGPSESCSHVLRTSKYNNPLGKVKNNLRAGGNPPNTCGKACNRTCRESISEPIQGP